MDAHLKRLLGAASGAVSGAAGSAAISAAISTAILATAITVASAGPMNDPTLPPAAATANSTDNASTTSTAAPSSVEPLRLQMIVRGPGEVRSAIVDGKAVRAGDTLTMQGESVRVLRISNSALVLQHADQSTETLELAPDAAKAITRSKTLPAPFSSILPSKTTQCSPGKTHFPATACNNAPPVESPR